MSVSINGSGSITGVNTLTSAVEVPDIIVSGISTLNNVIVGGATTAILVSGDLHASGIVTASTISASTQFNLPNNYALVAYSEGSSVASRGTTSVNYADDPDNATVRASFTYQRGDIIIFESFVPGGIALTSTDTPNYHGLRTYLRVSNGSTTADGAATISWYRNDGRSVKETMQLMTSSYIISSSDTTFNSGDTVYGYIRYAMNVNPAGSYSVGLCLWGGIRRVVGYQFRKVA